MNRDRLQWQYFDFSVSHDRKKTVDIDYSEEKKKKNCSMDDEDAALVRAQFTTISFFFFFIQGLFTNRAGKTRFRYCSFVF